MDISDNRIFSEGLLEEDPSSQWPFNSFHEFDDSMNMEAAAAAAAAAFAFVDSTHQHAAPMFLPTPAASKQLKTNTSTQNLHYYAHPYPKQLETIQFGSSAKKMVKSNNTNSNAPQDHILAERKRREKLSQRFIALSALIPGLKKMDKATVLGDAIKHLKNLQEKVKALEEQTKKESNVESVVSVKRYDQVYADGGEQLPEVEARFSGKDVLIRVHCENKPGVLEETLAEIEKLHLCVINTTAISFASYALDITVVAQMNEDFTMTMNDLVKNLCTRLM